jgi:hypothetical protein
VPLVDRPKELAAGRYIPLPVTDEPVGLNLVAVATPELVMPVVVSVPANVAFCEASRVSAVVPAV